MNANSLQVPKGVPSSMDSIRYDQFNETDLENNHHRQKVTLPHSGISHGRSIIGTHLLHGILLLLLLILLLLTGIEFSRLSREVSNFKHYLGEISSSAGHILVKENDLGHHTSDYSLHPHHYVEHERGPCDKGWLFFRDTCYQLSSKRASWHEAEYQCLTQEAHLVVINSEDEQVFVSDIATRENYWIGLVERHQEGEWTWVDGSNFNSTPHFWDVDQPDNWFLRANGEDCGQLHMNAQEQGLWNDADCSLKMKYICERKQK